MHAPECRIKFAGKVFWSSAQRCRLSNSVCCQKLVHVLITIFRCRSITRWVSTGSSGGSSTGTGLAFPMAPVKGGCELSLFQKKESELDSGRILNKHITVLFEPIRKTGSMFEDQELVSLPVRIAVSSSNHTIGVALK